jgi:type IV pilus assembly protein PilA
MMSKLMSKKGFTLIELMIVVAIIAILAAVAIPNFLSYQKRSRRAEGELIINGIIKAQKATAAEQNKFSLTSPFIEGALGLNSAKYSVDWYDTAFHYTDIGYVADEYIYCNYECVIEPVEAQSVGCGSECDIDADGDHAAFAGAVPNDKGDYLAGALVMGNGGGANCGGVNGHVGAAGINRYDVLGAVLVLDGIVRCTAPDIY